MERHNPNSPARKGFATPSRRDRPGLNDVDKYGHGNFEFVRDTSFRPHSVPQDPTAYFHYVLPLTPNLPPVPVLIMPTSIHYKDYQAYFRSLEKWLVCVIEVYKRSPAHIYNEQIAVSSIIRQMMDCAGYMYNFDETKFIKEGVEKRLWKIGIYAIINILRSVRQPVTNDFGPNVIHWSIQYFEDYLVDIQRRYSLDLSPLLEGQLQCSSDDTPDIDDIKGTPISETIYRVYIYIGDLGRYGAKMHPAFLQKAVKYYNAARLFDVTKGRSFYQLGVLWLAHEDYTQAMYNFFRADETEEPIEESRLQVQEVHDRAYKKRLRVKKNYWYALSKQEEILAKENRAEIWILPDSNGRIPKTVPAPKKIPPTKVEHIASLSTREIYRRFSLTYALVWGTLYSRIGLDNIYEVAEESLVYFEGILQRKNGIESMERMIQIVILGVKISCTIMELALQKSITKKQIKEDREFVIQYALELLTILSGRLLKLLYLLDWDDPYCNYISAAISVWTGWLRHSSAEKYWRDLDVTLPQFSLGRIEKTKYVNKKDRIDERWKIMSDLIKRAALLAHSKTIFPTIRGSSDSLENARLPETEIIQGLISDDKLRLCNLNFTDPRPDQVHFELLSRLTSIEKFGKFLEHHRPALIETSQKYNNGKVITTYNVVAKFEAFATETEAPGRHEANYHYWIGEFAHEYPNKNKRKKPVRGDSNSARIILRSDMKKQLKDPNSQKSLQPDWKDPNTVWNILRAKGFFTEMVIIPIRIVLDTNCFINKMEWVSLLRKYAYYPILLPVTVVLELKGLSKGGLRPKHREKFDQKCTEEAAEKRQDGNDTAEKSKNSLEFIKDNFRYFKVVSTNGRILPVKSIYEKINDDAFDPTKRNDNRILDTCVALEANDTVLKERNSPRQLFRGTVLVTNDRGLHIKTSTKFITSREIEAMVNWLAAWRAKQKTKFGK